MRQFEKSLAPRDGTAGDRHSHRPRHRTLAWRILGFNLLLVLVPALGFMFLDTYEDQLLGELERTMGQEARFTAAALAEMTGSTGGRALAYLDRLGQGHESRIRVIGADGSLLADSARLGASAGAGTGVAGSSDYRGSAGEVLRSVVPEDTFLYQLFTAPIRAWRHYADPDAYVVPPDFVAGKYLEAPEVRAAFAGRYGARTRVHGGTSPGWSSM